MTTRDYKMVAGALNRVKPRTISPYRECWNRVVEALVKDMKRDNPRFKPAQFRAACVGGDD